MDAIFWHILPVFFSIDVISDMSVRESVADEAVKADKADFQN